MHLADICTGVAGFPRGCLPATQGRRCRSFVRGVPPYLAEGAVITVGACRTVESRCPNARSPVCSNRARVGTACCGRVSMRSAQGGA